MTNKLQLVQQAAKQLQHEGKTVNLALLRARLAGQLAGPELFSTYQQWRNLPANSSAESGIVSDTELPAAPSATETPDTRLARIEAKLDRLLALLEQTDVLG
ncbi:MAG: hypothetical protein B7X50_06435 [Alishewanella sp. 34-51-39]|nr:MAG: hypothetical protein B7X50_06435 [Alishewanella sp. 34-51-39]